MITFFYTPLNSPVIIIVTILFFITSAITTFDIRMTQAKRSGDMPDDEPTLPNWVAIIFWFDWIFF